jgi:hypothetical protein
MPRYAYNVIAALLTFAIGIIVSMSSRGSFPLLAQLIPTHCRTERAAERPRSGACDEWEQATSVSNGLGWDLTYMSLLRNAGVCPGDIYCEIAAAKPQPPVDKLFAEWQGSPFISSILIEIPDGHADMQAWWLIRTNEQAYWSWFHPQLSRQMVLQPLPTKDYDRAFEAITCWQPDHPLNRKFFEGRGDGYIGFLSLYEKGKSRQMLLTYRDMLETSPQGSELDEATWGRLLKTMKPIYSAIREQRNQETAHSSK